MKFCPQCDREYDDDLRMCVDDGARLLQIESDEARDAALIGTVLEGRYRLDARLGKGGMGTVFSGVHTAMGRKVAVKVLAPVVAKQADGVRRFMQEARTASALSHPGIVGVYDFGQTPDGLVYLVMEFVPGKTLGKVMLEDGALGETRALALTDSILAALEAAHTAGVIHRDLKPENVILCPSEADPNALKVLDFGLAKLVSQVREKALTQTGQIFGTPGYMSPEQGRGEPCDGRTDIYSMGVILYEMLSGRAPFEGDTPLSILVKHFSEPPPPFDTHAPPVPVAPALAKVVYRMLEKEPDQRFSTVAEVRAALAEAQAESQSEPVQVERKTPALTWVLAGLGLVAIALAGWFLTRPDPTRPASPVVAADARVANAVVDARVRDVEVDSGPEAAPDVASDASPDAAPVDATVVDAARKKRGRRRVRKPPPRVEEKKPLPIKKPRIDLK